MSRVLLGFVLAVTVAGLYTEADEGVTILTADNFEKTVIETDGLFIVEFYAPWCGHCKSLTPEWLKLGKAMKGIAGVGALDMTEHSSVGEKYDVTGFPTIKIFGADKSKPTDFQGDRTAAKLAAGIINEFRAMLRSRLGVKAAPKAAKKAATGGAASSVVTLSESDFDETVMKSEDLWLVAFVAPWCGHCKSLGPNWKTAAKQLEGKVKMGSVDATVNPALAQKYDVKGYPTIKYFPKGPKTEAKEYAGGREADAIVDYALELIGEQPVDDTPDKVVVLTDADFDEKVVQSDGLWIVEFFAPWCGHCKTLAPEWKKSANDLDGQVNFATVDCTQHTKLKDKYDVESFPTLKVFSNDKSKPFAFESRTHQQIVSEATNLLEEHNTRPKPVVQLTENSVFTENCPETAGSLCALVFLPHILDTGAEGRNSMLGDLDILSKKYKRSKLAFMWAEGFTQQKLEAAFEVGQSGYPAMVIMNRKKNRYVPFLSSFSQEGVSKFIDGIFSGVERTIPMPTVPELDKVEAWDGKDGEAPKEEL